MRDTPNIRRLEKTLTILRRIAMGYPERSTDGNDYSRTQLDILTLIDDETDRTVKDLSSLLATTSGAVTQTVETLVRRGLVCKTQDQQDRRFTHLSLTDTGKQAVNHYYDIRTRMLQSMMAELDESEIRTMVSIAEKMLAFTRSTTKGHPASPGEDTNR